MGAIDGGYLGDIRIGINMYLSIPDRNAFRDFRGNQIRDHVHHANIDLLGIFRCADGKIRGL